MAIALIDKDEVNKGIDFIALRSINLRHFGGDELRLVAQFSGHFPEANFCDIVVPKIDRSCFNESSGSRKQTYSSGGSSNKYSNRRLGSSATSAAVIHRRSIGLTSPSRVHCCQGEVYGHTDELMPEAGTKYGIAMAAATLTSDEKVAEKSSARIAWKRASANHLAGKGQNERKGGLSRDARHSMEMFGSGEMLWAESKDRRTQKATNCEWAREGRLSKNDVSVALEEKFAKGPIEGFVVGRQPIQTFNDSEAEDELASRNRKRSSRSGALGQDGFVGAKRRRGSFCDTAGGSLFESRQRELNLRPERAEKHTGEGDMMERLAKMKGKWSSSERTRKIVDASGFPVGWTVRVGLGYKNGRTLFEYRDWRSPDGTLWASFKAASAFLLSSIRHDSTSEIAVLLKPGQGIIYEEGISTAKEKKTYETLRTCSDNLTRTSSVARHTDARKFYSLRLSEALDETDVGKDNLCGESSGKQFSRVHVDQSLRGCPSVDKIQKLTRPIGVEVASHAEKLIPEECHRRISNKGKSHESRQSACYMRSLTAFGTLLESHGCCDQMTKAILPSNEADLKDSPSKLHLDRTSWGMEISVNSGHFKIKNAECCSGLLPHNDSTSKCSSCGMMLSSLSKLRRHMRRAEHRKPVKCDVCGRHFSSIASLLGHRVKMGHPRLTRAITNPRRLQVKGSEAVSSLRSSKMFNIVLGLLSDTNGRCGFNAAEKSSSKSNLWSRDVLKRVNAEVREDPQKNAGLSDMFECKSCDKVFHHRAQYWGHLSIHSKQTKKAPKPRALLESVSKRSSTRVGSESNLAMVVRENCRREAGKKYAVESVFWRLLDGSAPLQGPNHELDPFKNEVIVRPPALHAKEEVISEIGFLTY